ncbi:sugar O-acetyltransferase [Candidimonas sp. SYP-B2681]|uniref:sugar O-acetyltransferase n=1 Tax=Candidimonas sp. SYP-B2681 TaxID=2497686 RepID=UPI000F86D396|nr:sugar O-acetyltransferase [Candidimonas sp. SYP-B2681]RTZ45659.1 sugar O-acetyltransferase [Candidimonas sp. SYP-B2681]
MLTEKQKMLAGELYDPEDVQLMAERQRARQLLQRLNDRCGGEQQARSEILIELFGAETDAFIQPPFFCDYGANISLGKKVFINFNCVILDVAPVTIGDYVLFGPNVQVYTATHPISAAERRLGLEYGKSVSIGSDVWIGGGAIVCPGVTIGAGSMIAAGSVVTRDVPQGVVAAGNPCRLIRSLPT